MCGVTSTFQRARRPEQLAARRCAILAAARKLMGDYRYNAATTQGTGDYSKVKLRFDAALQILQKNLR